MARPKRIQFDGAQYYVTVQALDRRKLFRRPEDFERMLGMIESNAEKHHVTVKAYCLLETRVELIVETPKANLSLFQQSYQTGYATYFRNQYPSSKGAIFADRYKAKLLANGPYLLALSAHVHLLPVQTIGNRKKMTPATPAQEVTAAARHPWSSLAEYTTSKEASNKRSFINTRCILKTVGGRVQERPKRYRAHLLDLIKSGDLQDQTAEYLGLSPLAIGDKEFLQQMEKFHKQLGSSRVPKQLRVHGQVRQSHTPKQIIKTVSEIRGKKKSEMQKQKKGSHDRALLSWALYEYSGLSQGDIASILGLSAGATVSQHNKRIREAFPTDKQLARDVKLIRSALDG